MAETQTITGKIIRILSTTEVIVNLGSDHGIAVGSVFRILGEPEPVIDPSTGKELGRVTVVKSKIAAAQVYEKFSVASTRWTQMGIPGLTTFGGLAGLTGLMRSEVVDQGELNVRTTDIQPWKAQSEKPVVVGDVVLVEVSKPAQAAGTDRGPASGEQKK